MKDWFSDGSEGDADLRLAGLARLTKQINDSHLLTLEQLAGSERSHPGTVFMEDRFQTRAQIKEGLLQSIGEKDYSKLTDYFVLVYKNSQNKTVVGRPNDMIFQDMHKHTAITLLGALLGKQITYESLADPESIGTISDVILTADRGLIIRILGKNNEHEPLQSVNSYDILVANGFILDLSKKYPKIRYGNAESSEVLIENENTQRRIEDKATYERYLQILSDMKP